MMMIWSRVNLIHVHLLISTSNVKIRSSSRGEDIGLGPNKCTARGSSWIIIFYGVICSRHLTHVTTGSETLYWGSFRRKADTIFTEAFSAHVTQLCYIQDLSMDPAGHNCGRILHILWKTRSCECRCDHSVRSTVLIHRYLRALLIAPHLDYDQVKSSDK
jgi:hypothetical protein